MNYFPRIRTKFDGLILEFFTSTTGLHSRLKKYIYNKVPITITAYLILNSTYSLNYQSKPYQIKPSEICCMPRIRSVFDG